MSKIIKLGAVLKTPEKSVLVAILLDDQCNLDTVSHVDQCFKGVFYST